MGAIISSKRLFFSEFAATERNVIIFGETGAGKSSLVNLLADDGNKAPVSNRAVGGTFQSTPYKVGIKGSAFTLWDTSGLNEGDAGSVPTEAAVASLRDLVQRLSNSGGISLLVYCVRSSRHRDIIWINYDVFARVFCQGEIPVVMVVTGLENEERMEDWWKENGKAFSRNMKLRGHACVTTTKGWEDRYEEQYNESKIRAQDLILESCSNTAWGVISIDRWLTHVSAQMQPYYDTRSAKLQYQKRIKGDNPRGESPPQNNADKFSRKNASAPQSQLPALVLDVMRNRRQREMIGALVGDEAQHVIEYFNFVLQEFDVFGNSEGLYLLSLFRKLANSAGVYPKCYLPKSIIRDASHLAAGRLGELYRVEENKQPLCLKVVRVPQKQEIAQLLRTYAKEIVLWSHLSHRNILPFFGVYLLDEPSQRICFVSPWMKNGNVLDYSRAHPETDRVLLVLDITEGLDYLHKANIVHGNIKAQNILVSDNGRALIADFGLLYAAIGGKQPSTQSSRGVVRWTAPEMLELGSDRVRPTRESDVWSFACLCYEVLTGTVPFYQYSSETALINALIAGKALPIRPEPGDTCDTIDDTMWSIMLRGLDYSPPMRPTCKDIRESIAGLQVRDTRPELSSTQLWDIAVKFRKAMMERSKLNIDYERVEATLLRIQRAAASTAA